MNRGYFPQLQLETGKIGRINDLILVKVRVANVTEAVLIGIALFRIGDFRAIIRLVGNAITIRVLRSDGLAGSIAGGIVAVPDNGAIGLFRADQPVEIVVAMGNLLGLRGYGSRHKKHAQ